jgi:Xaa-Pro aminopeptidase
VSLSTHANRLAALRTNIAAAGLDGFIVPRADEHLGEYVPPGAERLAWLTGFTGSAGLAAVLPDRAAAFTDGRYVLQLATQTDAALFEPRHLTDDPPPAWLKEHAAAGARIGYDPKLMSADALARYTEAGLTMVPTPSNPLDAAWSDRPPPPAAAAVPHPLGLAGFTSEEKRTRLAAELHAAGHDAAILTDPASICWLLNIRGSDLAYTPFALGFAILQADGAVQLFMDGAKLGPETRAWLGNGVAVNPPAALANGLAALAGKTVRVDRLTAPVWFEQTLRAAGAKPVDGPDPCALPKACKNPPEQDGTRHAHARDAVAVCRFLHWLDTGRTADTTEAAAAAKLLAFRQQVDNFREESFPAISGAGPNGAIIHYRVTPESDRVLGPDEVYLIDSGGQFPDGTTDVTRTIWTGPGTPPADLRDRFTRVLQGHIAIATAVFPQGVAGPHLDAMARRALWQSGLDYDHGTGHGVGSFLSVHEGPASLSRNARMVPLAAGMILSDEPGYYEPGAYGIRLENLVLVQPREFLAAKKPFLGFETLTLAPFDRRLVDASLLTPAERTWIDTYHARVLHEVGPALGPAEATWLAEACAPIA